MKEATSIRPVLRRCALLALAAGLGLQGCSRKGPLDVGVGPPLLLAFLSERPPSPSFITDIYFYDLARGGPAAMPPNVNTLSVEGPCGLSGDGRWLAFFSNRIPIGSQAQIFLYEIPAARLTLPLRMNQLFNPQNPALSGDGRYLAAQYQVSGPFDLYVAIEDLAADTLLPLPRLNEPNAATFDPALSGDGQLVAVASNRFASQGAFDIFLYSVAADSFLPLPGLNSVHNDLAPSISADGRYVAFQSGRPGGVGLIDVYLYDRQIQALVPLPGANTEMSDFQPALSPDGRYLAFATEAEGGRDVRVYNIPERRLLALPGLNDPYYFDSFPSLANR
jgi:Tol biopolymer transport system component